MRQDDSSQHKAIDEVPVAPTSTKTAGEELAHLHLDAWGWALTVARGDRCEAEEMLQTSYVRILEGQAVFRHRSSFKTWVFGVIRTVFMEKRRQQQAHESALNSMQRASHIPLRRGQDDALQQTQMSSRLRLALAQLSERQQQVLHLVFYQDLTIREAAQVLGIAPGSARTHYERGKHNLRTLIADGEGAS